MTGKKHVDYIIVGQGLAGSALALTFLSRKRKILVIDSPSANITSSIAAGLFNPLTGRKPVRTWKADELFSCLADFYRRAEILTGKRFFNPSPVYRPFLSVEEQNEWMGASSASALGYFIQHIATKNHYGALVNDPFGGLLLRHGGYLNTNVYMQAVRNLLQERASYWEEMLDTKLLTLEGMQVGYRDWLADGIIFCEGVASLSNEFFRWIPVRPLKGETLTIRASLGQGTIFNRGVYIVPGEQKDIWRVGATYCHGDFSPGTTPEGREELESKLSELIRVPYEVLDHQWGVRPTTPDHRPLLGRHPGYAPLIFFNGFGTKGVSLTPYFAAVLAEWLENKGVLNNDVDISRYKSLYSKSPG